MTDKITPERLALLAEKVMGWKVDGLWYRISHPQNDGWTSGTSIKRDHWRPDLYAAQALELLGSCVDHLNEQWKKRHPDDSLVYCWKAQLWNPGNVYKVSIFNRLAAGIQLTGKADTFPLAITLAVLKVVGP